MINCLKVFLTYIYIMINRDGELPMSGPRPHPCRFRWAKAQPLAVLFCFCFCFSPCYKWYSDIYIMYKIIYMYIYIWILNYIDSFVYLFALCFLNQWLSRFVCLATLVNKSGVVIHVALGIPRAVHGGCPSCSWNWAMEVIFGQINRNTEKWDENST